MRTRLRTPTTGYVRPERTPEVRAHRPRALWALVLLLGVLVIGGFDGGFSFVMDPTGTSLGAKLSWLAHTPVNDFLLPGLFLLGVYGIGGSILIAGLVTRGAPGRLRALDRAWGHHWAWVGSIAFGATLVLWIVYELLVMPAAMFLQPVLIVVGLAITALPLLPSLREWFTVPREEAPTTS